MGYIAKFVPGLSAVAAPLAGSFRAPVARFVPYAAAGALIWAIAWISVGYLFSNALEQVAAHAARLGTTLAAVLGAALAGYVLYKYLQRRRFLRTLRVARITPNELKQKLPNGDPVMILDLRTPLQVQAAPYTIPGALRAQPEDIANHLRDIPRNADIVVYCS